MQMSSEMSNHSLPLADLGMYFNIKKKKKQIFATFNNIF